jgi:NDP-sugar pyrophosphorylase family protein
MQAVILAGGLGTRLRPLTDAVPKVMVKVQGTEFLWYLVSWLTRNDINDIVICAAHLSEHVAQKLSSCPCPPARIRISVEKHPLGTAGAVKNAEPFLAQEFILINGDTFLPVRYDAILSRWRKIRDRFDSLLLVYTNDENIAPNDTSLDDDNVVVGYSKRSPKGMNLVNAGLLVVKRSVFEKLPQDVPASLEEEIFPDLIRRRKMAALITRERYYDIGSPERLKAFEEYVDRHPEMVPKGMAS